MGLATWDAAETTRALRLVRGGCGCLFFLSGGLARGFRDRRCTRKILRWLPRVRCFLPFHPTVAAPLCPPRFVGFRMCVGDAKKRAVGARRAAEQIAEDMVRLACRRAGTGR
jgi:hypothetical protein